MGPPAVTATGLAPTAPAPLAGPALSVAIAGLGTAVPGGRLTNADLAATMDTSDEWIVERTGIRERRIAAPGETSGSLAVEAGAAALRSAGTTPESVDLLVVATATPDQALPHTGAFVGEELGLACGSFDLAAACAGFVYGLVVGASLLHAGMGRVLVIGSDTFTRTVEPGDRATAVLFGDGAGAAVLTPSTGGAELLAWDLGCDGSAAGLLEIPPGTPWLRMAGQEVFRRAVRVAVDSGAAGLARAGLTSDDVDWYVPHQANLRIIEAARRRLGVPPERTLVNVDRYGNTSAASVPLALSEAVDDGRIADGDLVLAQGFGAGMTWASVVLRWGST